MVSIRRTPHVSSSRTATYRVPIAAPLMLRPGISFKWLLPDADEDFQECTNLADDIVLSEESFQRLVVGVILRDPEVS